VLISEINIKISVINMEISVFKIGGNVIDNQAKLNAFLDDFATYPGRKVLVHGGGKLASDLSRRLGIEPQMVNGRRITDEQTLDIATMVYAGLINKKIVAGLQARQCNAIGLCGADANVLTASKRPVKDIDYGLVGDIRFDLLDATPLKLFVDNGLTAVFSAITHDRNGQLLNTNADTIASSIALALSKEYETSLVYCFEKLGVLSDPNDDDSVITFINAESYEQLKADQIVTAGMLPKLDNAFAALKSGVAEVRICSSDFFAQKEKGTTIKL
jgi:acetylglutamate kinase